MNADPDAGFWVKLAAAVISGLGLLFGYHKWMEGKIAKKADKHTVNNELQILRNEQNVQRGNIGKLFDQMRESEAEAQRRHRELLMHLLNRSDQQ